MSGFNYFKMMMRPIMPFVLLLAGGLMIIYEFGTSNGGKVMLATGLVMVLGGILLLAIEEAKRSEFFQQNFGEKLKKKTKGRKKMGKRCPNCNKIIHHCRTICQHCGHIFPSHDYKMNKAISGKKESSDRAEENA